MVPTSFPVPLIFLFSTAKERETWMEGFSLVPREEKKPRGWSGVVTQEKKKSILIGQGSRGRSEGLSKNMVVKYGGIDPLCKSED